MGRAPSLLAGLARTTSAVLVIGALAAGAAPARPASNLAASNVAAVVKPAPAVVPVAPVVPARAVATKAVTPAAASLKLRGFSAQPLDQPVAIAAPHDGTGRLFVVERAGLIVILGSTGKIQGTYLDISGRVNSSGGEQGLLGLAFSPAFKTNGRFYVSYTDGTGALVVSEFDRASATAASTTEHRIIRIPHPDAANHNGGNLVFGPKDGYLYISTGDGGSGGDPWGHGQSRTQLLGKILRISPRAGGGYAIPRTNPYATSAKYRHEIWAYGLRNPWKYSFDRANGNLWIGDVGQDAWEEIDRATYASGGGRGLNFGWHMWEGNHCYTGTCTTAGKTFPMFEYGHGVNGCAVVGGYVYRGTLSPALKGSYLFSDNCSGRIWRLSGTGASVQTARLLRSSTGLSPSAFGEADNGELYIADLGSGYIYHLVYK